MKTQVRLLSLETPEELASAFRRIGVDGCGSAIMRRKGFVRFFRVERIPSFCANILKQEMLSLGADAAVSRGALTGGSGLTDCLLFGNLSHFEGLIRKLKKQPFGLAELGDRLRTVLAGLDRPQCALRIGSRRVTLGRRTWLMGVVNVTPDSFSGDGVAGLPVDKIVRSIESIVEAGADIIDIGGESSRPGARAVRAKEELRRVIPVIKALCRRVRVPICVDTTKSEVARAALEHGAAVINDISALRRDAKMAKVAARYKAAVVLMHMQGTPRTMQRVPRYGDVMADVVDFLGTSIDRARQAGVADERIIVDPGIGFGKTFGHNIEILRRLAELRIYGRPVLVGLSRKAFIGKVLRREPKERVWGTASAATFAVERGADIMRVHDVREMKQVVRMTDALTK